MGKQILNRREAIYAEEIPPEIADTSGFIEATDYATDTTGGTVKIDEDYGVELTTAGFLRGTVETADAYAEAGNNLLVSKGTLDAVLAAQPAPSTGIEMDELLSATVNANAGYAGRFDLLEAYSDYKILFFTFETATDQSHRFSVPVISALIRQNTNHAYVGNYNDTATVGKITFATDTNNKTIYLTGSQYIQLISVKGVK